MRMDHIAHIVVIVAVFLVSAVLVGCGSDRSIQAGVALPSSGREYRGLDVSSRTAVAASCRDRVAASSSGEAAGQLESIDPSALRSKLDDAFTIIAAQRRSVADVCTEVVPFVTPGLDVRLDRAKEEGDGSFSYETDSDKLLMISGRVSPASQGGRVVARRELGSSRAHTASIGAGGRFAVPPLHLRKLSENTFTLAIEAPPSAPRKVHFSAICLDCLAGGPPPTAGSR
jgi:hypothetical protein